MTAKPPLSAWLHAHRQQLWICLAFGYGLVLGGFGILLGVAERILSDWAASTNLPPPLNMPLYQWSDGIMAYYLVGGLSLVGLLIGTLLLGLARQAEASDKP